MTVIPRLVHFGSLEDVYPLVLRLLKLFGTWGPRRRLFGLYAFFLCHFFLRLLPSIIYLDTSDIHAMIRHLGEIVFISMLYPVFIVYVWKLPKLMALTRILRAAFAECKFQFSHNFTLCDWCILNTDCRPHQSPEYREAIVKTNRFIRNICRFYFAYTGLNTSVYIVAPPVSTFYKYLSWKNSSEPFYFNFPNEYDCPSFRWYWYRWRTLWKSRYRLPYMDHYNVWHYVIVESLISPVFFWTGIFLAMKSMVYYSLIKYVSLMFKLVIVRIRLLDSALSTGGGSRLQRAVDDVIREHYLALRWVTCQGRKTSRC